MGRGWSHACHLPTRWLAHPRECQGGWRDALAVRAEVARLREQERVATRVMDRELVARFQQAWRDPCLRVIRNHADAEAWARRAR